MLLLFFSSPSNRLGRLGFLAVTEVADSRPRLLDAGRGAGMERELLVAGPCELAASGSRLRVCLETEALPG